MMGDTAGSSRRKMSTKVRCPRINTTCKIWRFLPAAQTAKIFSGLGRPVAQFALFARCPGLRADWRAFVLTKTHISWLWRRGGVTQFVFCVFAFCILRFCVVRANSRRRCPAVPFEMCVGSAAVFAHKRGDITGYCPLSTQYRDTLSIRRTRIPGCAALEAAGLLPGPVDRHRFLKARPRRSYARGRCR